MAACLLENRREEPTIGAIFDGTGYGDDGTIWGGEFLVADMKSYERKGSTAAAHFQGRKGCA